MADLLECLIQIKGLANTPQRLRERIGAFGVPGTDRPEADRLARAVIGTMVDADAHFEACLETMLAAVRPHLPAWSPGTIREESSGSQTVSMLLDRFEEGRRRVVERLDACSADDLGRIGLDPSRGPTTVADLVAVMLAHDTDQIGRLVQGLVSGSRTRATD